MNTQNNLDTNLNTPPKSSPKATNIVGAKSVDERRRLGVALAKMVRDGIQQRPTQERWDSVEKFYRCENEPASNPSRRRTVQHPFPVLTPRIEQMASNVLQAIVSNKPFMRALRRQGGTRSDVHEAVLQFHWEIGGIEPALESILPDIGTVGQSVIRPRFQPAGVTSWRNPDIDLYLDDESAERTEPTSMMQEDASDGPMIVFDVIHARDFVILPATVRKEADAELLAHRFYLSRRIVWERQRHGEWFMDTAHGSAGDPSEHNQAEIYSESTPTSIAAHEAHRTVELFGGIVRLDLNNDGQSEAYRFVLDMKMEALLDISRYDQSVPEYARIADHRESGGFWNVLSKGTLLQGLQISATEVVNQYLDGTEMSIRPPTIGNGVDATMTKRVTPGGFYDFPDLMGEPAFMPVAFDPKPVPYILMQIENKADAIAGITQMGMGQQLRSGATATEAAQLAAGQSVSVARTIANVGYGLETLARITTELLVLHWDEWYPYYKNLIPAVDKSQIAEPVAWELTGKTPSIAPVAVVEKLRLFFEFAFSPVIQGQLQTQRQMEAAQPGSYAELGLPDPREAIKALIRELGLQDIDKLLPSIDHEKKRDLEAIVGDGPGAAFGILPELARVLGAGGLLGAPAGGDPSQAVNGAAGLPGGIGVGI